jgi:hypothetical protein
MSKAADLLVRREAVSVTSRSKAASPISGVSTAAARKTEQLEQTSRVTI